MAEITVPAVRDAATALLADVTTHAEAMLAYLLERIPEAGADAEIEGLTLGSCSSNLEAVLSMIRLGIPATSTQAPVTALEHARAMAARGHSVDLMLRFYRLGHAWFVEQVLAGIGGQTADDHAALEAFTELQRFAFVYIDRISAQVASEYVAELERRQNRARAVRSDAVRALLSGAPLDHARAERALGHRLGPPQTAFVCWTDRGDVDLARAGAAIGAALGSERPLLVPDGARSLWGWVAGATGSPMVVPSVHVALGEPLPGAGGFRASHEQAQRARRIVVLSRRDAPTVTAYTDVALVDALTQDLDAARALVARALGPLAADGPREHDERQALLALLDAQGSFAAAGAALGLHRNTVLQRVRRAEQRRGRPADDGRLELHAALTLTDTLGAAAMCAPHTPPGA